MEDEGSRLINNHHQTHNPSHQPTHTRRGIRDNLCLLKFLAVAVLLFIFTPHQQPTRNPQPNTPSFHAHHVISPPTPLKETDLISQFESTKPISCSSLKHNPNLTLAVFGHFSQHEELFPTCHRWRGPIVAVLLLTHTNQDTLTNLDTLYRHAHAECPHLNLFIATPPTNHDHNNLNFPTNELRNCALSHIETSHMIITGIGSLPSTSLYDELTSLLRTKDVRVLDNALVIPSFSLSPACAHDPDLGVCGENGEMPSDTDDLSRCIRMGMCEPHHLTTSPLSQSSSHSHFLFTPTNTTPTTITIPCFHHRNYEPIVMTRTCRTPKFVQSFDGTNEGLSAFTSYLRRSGLIFSSFTKGFFLHRIDTTGAVGSAEHRSPSIRRTFDEWLETEFKDNIPEVLECTTTEDEAIPLAIEAHQRVYDVIIPDEDELFTLLTPGKKCQGEGDVLWMESELELSACLGRCHDDDECRFLSFNHLTQECVSRVGCELATTVCLENLTVTG